MTDATGNGSQAWPQAGVGSRTTVMHRPEPAPKRVLASLGFVVDATRRRRSGRFALWAVVVALAGAGVLMLSYPLITDLWANRIQGGLRKQFQQIQASGGFDRNDIPIGSAVTRLRIPKLGVDVVVVEGWTGNALRAGAGHKPGTPLPGDQIGNVPIAGHRTGFGQPFRHLERLGKGDRIELITPFGTYLYLVEDPFDGHPNPWVTEPDDLTVVQPTGYGALTLITCDPPHTSKARLIVRARLAPGP